LQLKPQLCGKTHFKYENCSYSKPKILQDVGMHFKVTICATDFQTVFKSVRIIKSVLNRYFSIFIQASNLAEKLNFTAVEKICKRRSDIKQYSSSPKL